MPEDAGNPCCFVDGAELAKTLSRKKVPFQMVQTSYMWNFGPDVPFFKTHKPRSSGMKSLTRPLRCCLGNAHTARRNFITCVLSSLSTYKLRQVFFPTANDPMLSMLCMPRISKYLMQNRGFNIILCESDWTFMWHVNQYVHRSLGQTGSAGRLSCGFVCCCHPMFSPTYPRKKSKMFPDTTRFPASWRIEAHDFRGLFCFVLSQRPVGAAHNIRIGCGKTDPFMSWWSG